MVDVGPYPLPDLFQAVVEFGGSLVKRTLAVRIHQVFSAVFFFQTAHMGILFVVLQELHEAVFPSMQESDKKVDPFCEVRLQFLQSQPFRMFSVSYYVINPSFLSVLFFLLLSGSSLSVFQVL